MAVKPKGKFPQSFHASILLRVLGEKGVMGLYEEYAANYAVRVGGREPSDKQIHLANLARDLGVETAAKKAGVSTHVVNYAIKRVGGWNFMQSKQTTKKGK